LSKAYRLNDGGPLGGCFYSGNNRGKLFLEPYAIAERLKRIERLRQIVSRQEDCLRREIQQLWRRGHSLQQEVHRLPWPRPQLRIVSAAQCCSEESYRHFLQCKQEMLRRQHQEILKELAEMRKQWQKVAQTLRILNRVRERLEAEQQKAQQHQEQELWDVLIRRVSQTAARGQT